MTSPNPTPAQDPAIDRFREIHDRVLHEVERSLLGKTQAARLALACLFSGGHLLIEDVPGTGKTSLAKALASGIAGTWQRVQFTPDLLPGDITGVSVWNQRTERFEFKPGPIFASVVLADEINRASPKTQSALLEVMEEGQVTVDGIAHPVPDPFLVVATQNPVDMEGTYQLPEAQLDRFTMRIALGQPDLEVETAILLGRAGGSVTETRSVTTLDEVRMMRRAAANVHVAPEIAQYIARLAVASRTHGALRLGVSTRGSLALQQAARAYAAGHGRHYVVADDVRALAHPVLAHRLMVNVGAAIKNTNPAAVLDELLDSVPAPGLWAA